MRITDFKGRYFELSHGLTTEGTYKRSAYRDSNQAKAVGYLVRELEMDGNFPLKVDGEFVEKGRKYLTVAQTRQMLKEGTCVNAYLQKQMRKGKETFRIMPKGNKNGFSKDSNVRYAFKTDDEGEIVKPYEMDILEEECSSKLWDMLLERQAKPFRVKRTRKLLLASETAEDKQKRKELESYLNTLMENVGADDVVTISNPLYE